MPSSGMLRHVALVKTDILVEHSVSSETSVLTRVTRCKIPEDSIHHSHRQENKPNFPSRQTPDKIPF
jgi:hypothetical protein